jgi:hypothetical protein
MNQSMKRLLGWAWLGAGTFGVAVMASAQTSPYARIGHPVPVLPTPAPALPTPAPVLPTVPEVETSRIIAPGAVDLDQALMRIELGWLSDPSTFPYRLEARPMGSALAVQGYVPTELIRDVALKIAREESGLRVLDTIDVYAAIAATPVKKPANLLHREAAASLRQELRQRARAVSASVWDNGQVQLKGSVPSLEDKLAASRCLRRVSGCTCVLNQLEVAPAAHSRTAAKPALDFRRLPAGDKIYAQTTWVPAEAVMAPTVEPQPSLAVQPLAVQPFKVQSIKVPSIAPMEPIGDSRVHTTLRAPRVSSEEPAKPAPALTQSKSNSAAGNLALPAAPKTTAAAASRTTIGNSNGAYSAAPVRPLELTHDPIRAPFVEEKKAGTPAAAGRLALTTESTPTPEKSLRNTSVPAEASPVKTQPPMLPVVSWKPIPADAAVGSAVAPLPPASKPERPSRSDGYVSSGVILIPTAEKETRPQPGGAYVSSGVILVQAEEKNPQLPRKSDGYVSSGVVLFESTEKAPAPKVRPEVLLKQTRLQQAIAKACGKANKDVEVKLVSEKEVVVRVKAYNAREGQALSTAIFKMPELEKYQVSLDIPLKP